MPPKDWTRGKVRYELEKIGRTTLRQIDLEFGVPVGTISNTLYRPDPKGERILSQILGISACQIWPSRYDKDGLRLTPQPTNKPRTEANARHRQKQRAA